MDSIVVRMRERKTTTMLSGGFNFDFHSNLNYFAWAVPNTDIITMWHHVTVQTDATCNRQDDLSGFVIIISSLGMLIKVVEYYKHELIILHNDRLLEMSAACHSF